MKQAYKSSIQVRLPEDLVCMVKDDYIGRPNLPIHSGSKTYYCCCDSCVDWLQKHNEFRYSIDPLTKEKVDKASSYIVRQSDKTFAVFYFKSKESHDMYVRDGSR